MSLKGTNSFFIGINYFVNSPIHIFGSFDCLRYSVRLKPGCSAYSGTAFGNVVPLIFGVFPILLTVDFIVFIIIMFDVYPV